MNRTILKSNYYSKFHSLINFIFFRMRDLSNEEKHQNQRLGKQNEKLQSELVGLRKDKEKQLNEILELQNQTIELKEQVMNSLSLLLYSCLAQKLNGLILVLNLKILVIHIV